MKPAAEIARGRSKPWQIAADLENAAHAILAAEKALDAVHSDASDEISAIPGQEMVNHDMAAALQALSDKYQAIADGDPEPGSDEWLKRSPQFHPGDIA
jgi:hypothetical protein